MANLFTNGTFKMRIIVENIARKYCENIVNALKDWLKTDKR